MLCVPQVFSPVGGATRLDGPSDYASGSRVSSSSPAQAPSSPPFSTTPPTAPPSLREILDAFSSNGSGDRELLLAILGAKRAEEEVSLNGKGALVALAFPRFDCASEVPI